MVEIPDGFGHVLGMARLCFKWISNRWCKLELNHDSRLLLYNFLIQINWWQNTYAKMIFFLMSVIYFMKAGLNCGTEPAKDAWASADLAGLHVNARGQRLDEVEGLWCLKRVYYTRICRIHRVLYYKLIILFCIRSGRHWQPRLCNGIINQVLRRWRLVFWMLSQTLRFISWRRCNNETLGLHIFGKMPFQHDLRHVWNIQYLHWYLMWFDKNL